MGIINILKMKFLAVVALFAVVSAQDEAEEEEDTGPAYPGKYCDSDSSVCQDTSTTCVSWKDSLLYPRKSCEDCLDDNRDLVDEYDEPTTFVCPGEEVEGASALTFGAAAILAAVTMMN